MRKHLLFAAVSVLVAACWEDDRSIAWDRDRTVLGPIQLKSQVAYVDSALDRVTLLDLGGDKPQITTTKIGRRAVVAIPSPDRHLLFVITRGEEAIHAGEIDQAPMFWVVDTVDKTRPPLAYKIGSPFDRIAVSPDNQTVVTYFSDSGPDAQGFFRNPNELAVIHLDEAPGDGNPTLKNIRSFGSVPDGIVLSPPMVVPGAADPTPRTFAFVMSPDNLTMLDATYPDRRETSIRLDLGGQPVLPREIVFAPNTSTAYVRSDNARDILELTLDPIAPASDDSVDFRPLLAELGAGGGPTDIAVYDDPAGRRYVLASTPNTHEVVVIDADTAQFRTVDAPDPYNQILLFPVEADTPPTKALFATVGSQLSRAAVLDLDDIQDPLIQPQLRMIDVAKPVRDLVAVPGRDLAMLVHDDARTVLGLLDMDTESTSPLLGVGRLDSYDFTPTGSHLLGTTNGISRVGFVSLDNLHPTDFRLDDHPTRVLSATNGKIFVDHGDPFGHATIIPSPEATRDDAIVLTGFLATDLLDQEP